MLILLHSRKKEDYSLGEEEVVVSLDIQILNACPKMKMAVLISQNLKWYKL